MAQTIDNRIKITHFINPHLFAFKWVRDEGFNEDLDKLEKKVESAAKQRVAESVNGDPKEKKFKMSDVVAVFVNDWHKYVRANVKRKEVDDLYCVWAIDYGVPMIVHASNMVKLPNAFTGMHLNKNHTKLVHWGGMENCLPAEKQFNVAMECSDKQKLLNWTPQAIDLVQKILNQAVKLEFEHVQDLSPLKRPHYFGRLMMQRQTDGQMINVVKSLLEMNYAVLAEQEFKMELASIDSLSQSVIFSVNNELLDVKTIVVPVKTISNTDNGYTNSDIFETESENEFSIDEDGGDLPIEENEFFDDSASVMQPRLQNQSIVCDALETVAENQVENSNSNTSQAKSKSNQSKGKSDNDAENNITSKKLNNEKQQPKSASKNRDRKQRNKNNSFVSNQKREATQNQQHEQPKQQPQKQQSQPAHKQPSKQDQQQNNHRHHHQMQQQPHQQYHRQSMSFDQSGALKRASNGDQNQNYSNFQHLHHPKSFSHPAAQNHPHMRNPQDARFNGCTEFEAILGKPPPNRHQFVHPPPPQSPFIRQYPPPPLFGSIPPRPQYPVNFSGMYGPAQSGPGQSHPYAPRQSNMRNSNKFHENATKQAQNLMSMLKIQPQSQSKFDNNENQRGQNRMRNRNSGFQGRNNQSADNVGKVNFNGNNEKPGDTTADEIKPVVKDSPIPSKDNSEKSEKSQTNGEQVE